MTDGLGIFDDLSDESPASNHDRRGRERRGGAERHGGTKRRRRRLKWTIVLVAFFLIIGGAGFGALQVMGLGYYPDYSGASGPDVIFEVSDGDTARTIGGQLQQAGVVASANAFVKAAKSNSAVTSVQPGYYVMKQHSSGAAAVAQLVNPSSRVGVLEVRPGWQLDDTKGSDGKVTKGILSHIAAASCAMLNGRSTCLSVADLQAAIANNPPAALGVPDWAVPNVAKADPRHRLEGLIAPGIYNIKPGETATQTLQSMLAQSVNTLQAAGLTSTAQQGSGFTPYQVLIMASIVERESGTPADMPKIARVLYNRLADVKTSDGKSLQGKLELDSTVDYALDRPMVRTSVADRAPAGAYDTYDNAGLPPTPISSPSTTAIEAAEQPADGPWVYFVVCQKDGSSCFATNLADHTKNVVKAQADGAY